jgi:cadmium resistance protein CadD (predicted permease)
MGLTCIIVPHIAFYFVMGDNFGGFVPNWLLWFTAALHMLYMVFSIVIRISTTWMANKLAEQVCINIRRKFFPSWNDLRPQF